MIRIEINEQVAIERQKKDGSGNYYLQTAYAHTVDRDGKAKRYPEEIEIFVQRDDRGTPMPYAPGMYKVSPNSLRVSYRKLEMGFLNIQPIAAKAEKAA